MFTIQYQTPSGEHKMTNLNSYSRTRLITMLARFDAPIIAVYEQSSVITKEVRRKLNEYPGSKSRCAMDFVKSLD